MKIALYPDKPKQQFCFLTITNVPHNRSQISFVFLTRRWSYLEAKEMKLFTNPTTYLGHAVNPRLQKQNPRPTEQRTKSKYQNHQQTFLNFANFLGLCSVFRRFVPRIARIPASWGQKLGYTLSTNVICFFISGQTKGDARPALQANVIV